ncbi:MAG: MFS transporter [Actinobacteria bacterium]|nr:MFS transporter [Actinomycetota bacterium]
MRRPNFELLVGAIFLSALGDWLALTALALHLAETTGSGLALSGLFIALWLPLVLFAGHAGLLVDRLDARLVLVVSSVVQALVAAGLAFADELVPILVLTAALGTANAVSQPAEFALIPAVVPEHRLVIANGQVETARFIGAAAGPLLGGLLAGLGGTQLPLLVDAASFLVIAAAAAALTVTTVVAVTPDEPLGRARDGFTYLTGDPLLRLVMLVAFTSLLFMTASAPAEVFFAKDVLDVGDAGFGALWTSWFVGMAIGGLALARRVPAKALISAALVATVVQSLGLAIPTLWLSLAFALAFYAIGGAAHGTKNVLVRTLLHKRVPTRLHGRAFAAYNGIRNGAEMVALVLGGALVAAIGARWTLFLAGVLPAIAGLAGLVAYRRMRSRTVAEPASEPV